MKIAFESFELPKTGVVLVAVAEDTLFSSVVSFYDELTQGALKLAIQDQRFKGKSGQTLVLTRPQGGLQTLVLAGVGKLSEWNEVSAIKAGGGFHSLISEGASEAVIIADELVGTEFTGSLAIASIAYGVLLRSYRFDTYQLKKQREAAEKPEEQPMKIEHLTLRTSDKASTSNAFAQHEAVARGVFFARDLVTEPGNVLYPQSYSDRLHPLKEIGLEVEVLTEEKLAELGFDLLLSVGIGSERESQLAILNWRGLDDVSPPVALVGKGVTFDTGGISIKPSAGMGDMKFDMAGSAAVVGTLIALASRKAKANVVGVIALAENMPSGAATRPGDVVTSLSGQTVENLNTDAEGRLVLADAIWYTEERFQPTAMIDLATLTGAILVALGEEFAGLFANDDKLAEQLTAASAATGEKLWRMPMADAYDKELDSDIADMKNIGNGRNAGSALGAHFLKRFVRKTPWAHLDIAGMAWAGKAADITPKGATAWGVRLLDRLIHDHYEQHDL
jgi:leucyl aminopeptidase